LAAGVGVQLTFVRLTHNRSSQVGGNKTGRTEYRGPGRKANNVF
jgi:hypothetical protein